MKTSLTTLRHCLLLVGFFCITHTSFAFYNPETGRWLSRDPIQEKGGINVYVYVANDPIRTVDPVGLAKVYGNWCGPNWTGGIKSEYDPNGGPYLPAIDALDSACEIHDKCYFNCRQKFPCDPTKRSNCFRNCDTALTKAAYAFGGIIGRTIGAGIDRPGKRDPGPNKPCCNTPSPPSSPPSWPPLGF